MKNQTTQAEPETDMEEDMDIDDEDEGEEDEEEMDEDDGGGADDGEKASGEVFEQLKADHRKVQELFKKFEEGDKRARTSIADEVLMALEIHSALEEELVYPAIAEVIHEQDLVDEAREEHHVVKLLIKELRKMDVGDKGFATKFKVLGELVGHHIEEEENEMFPQAEEADIDAEALTEEVSARRDKLTHKYEGAGKKSSRGKRKNAA